MGNPTPPQIPAPEELSLNAAVSVLAKVMANIPNSSLFKVL